MSICVRHADERPLFSVYPASQLAELQVTTGLLERRGQAEVGRNMGVGLVSNLTSPTFTPYLSVEFARRPPCLEELSSEKSVNNTWILCFIQIRIAKYVVYM